MKKKLKLKVFGKYQFYDDQTLKKIFRMMRLTVFCFFLGFMQVIAVESYAQMTKLSVKLNNEPLEQVLKFIEDESEFFFLYNRDLIDVEQKVSVNAENKTIKSILDDVLVGTDISFVVYDRQIVLTNTSVINEMVAQQSSVSGKVTDKSGQPLPGVTVVVKGTTNGTVTNADGTYSLSNIPENATLVFSFVGMRTQEITIGNQTKINVTMEDETIGLDEVVAIGYGTQKKRDIAGSISSVKGTDLTKSGLGNAVEALQGRIAGVSVVSNSGKPGTGVSLRIRGIGGINNSDPLYVIDGIQGGDISEINSNDIQSIEVLKDAASSAIYGARGANGVVIVTTKRGEQGKPKITYNGSYGVQNMMNPNNLINLNAQEYAETINKAYIADGQGAVFGGTNTEKYPVEYFPAPSELGKGTDWTDVMTNKNAPIQEHVISVSGGNENQKVYVSLGYLKQDGIVVFTGYERYSFVINTDHKINNWLKFGNNTSLLHSVKSGGTVYGDESGMYTDMFYMFTQPSTLPVYEEDGSFAGPPTPFYRPTRNPYAVAANTDANKKSNAINNNIYIELNPIKYLMLKSSFITILNSSNYDYFYNGIFEEGITKGSQTSLNIQDNQSLGWMWSNTINYNRDFDDHSLNLLGGYEVAESSSSGIIGYATYSDPSIKVVGTNGALTASINQSKYESSTISYFGRAAYNYKSKYYLTGNIRRDGSSKFGANNRFGVFPSFSGAWRLSGEDFFPKNIFSDLKLRAGYGEVGNDKIGDYSFLAPLTTVIYSMTGQNGSFNNGLAVASVANPDLKWETTKQLNFGIDVAAFDNKLTFAAEYFKTDVTDMLLGVSIPTTSGISDTGWGRYAYLTTNLGALTNKGFEFDLNYRGSVRDITYSLNANLTTFDNEVTDIGENPYLQGTVSRTYKGGSLGDFYGYVCEGIFQTQAEVDAANALNGNSGVYYQFKETAPGDFKYADLNGDKIINDKDQKVIGSPVPKFTYGFGINVSYKQFSLNSLFTGIYGNEIYNGLRGGQLEATGDTYNKSSTVLNAWDGEGTSNTIPRRLPMDVNQNSRVSTMYLESGSFLRLRNIVISYSLSKSATQKFACDNATVFLAGDNLFTIANYKGFDPEVSTINNLNAGLDNSFYPHASIVRMGLKITF
jgi:TonB-linked SusC/RagA family outer membrane protein